MSIPIMSYVLFYYLKKNNILYIYIWINKNLLKLKI